MVPESHLSLILSTMKRLLQITALLEAATGLALLTVPAVVVRLLLGGEITGVSISLGRVAGMGLLSLGIACWPGRDATGNKPPALWAMLTYNSLAALYFLYLGIGGDKVGPLLWPAAALHAILTFLLARCCFIDRHSPDSKEKSV